MSEPRLKTRLLIQAAIRRCGMEAIPVMVVHKGDDDAGTVLVRVELTGGMHRIYAQTRDGQGRAGWLCVTGDQPVDGERASAYIDKARRIDRDVWVLDVDSPKGHVPFLDPIIQA